MAQLNAGEQRFAAYLYEFGYGRVHELDYQAELALAERLVTKPSSP